MSANTKPPTCARPPRRVEHMTEAIGGFVAWLRGIEQGDRDMELRGHRVLASYGLVAYADRARLLAILREAQP